jgi:hypothetical protein
MIKTKPVWKLLLPQIYGYNKAHDRFISFNN